ncbi:MAG: hypothetical protein M5U19_02310 [Microthrixaceae bacterium]|nr:hypothetical protein [Microthrixaceae bacterium]
MSTRPRRPAVLFMVVAVLLGACTSGEDDAARRSDAPVRMSTTTTTTIADLAAELESPGEWAVGVRTATVTGARGRALPVQIWYPVDPEGTDDAEPATYPFPGVSIPSEMGFADVLPAPGPFPLVVYSHGNGGLGYVSAFLTEHLASHGFIVVAPDHVGNTAIDAFAGTSEEQTQVALDRPVDVSGVDQRGAGGRTRLRGDRRADRPREHRRDRAPASAGSPHWPPQAGSLMSPRSTCRRDRGAGSRHHRSERQDPPLGGGSDDARVGDRRQDRGHGHQRPLGPTT